MKNKLYLLPLIAIFLFGTFTACKKYSEGPVFSLRSKTERVANNWKVENYKINGSDFTSLVSDYTETFTKENNYSYTWGIFNGSCKWAFQNNNMEIKLDGAEGTTSRILFIEKLEEKTFWYYYMDGSDKCEVHLTEK